MTRRRLLIVGNGMVTDRLLDELGARGALDRLEVTVIGEEAHGAYNRILLSHVLGGDDPDAIVTRPPPWYGDAGVRLIRDRWVQRLDTRARLAHIGNGETVAYDTAVLATGASPLVPPIADVRTPSGDLTRGVHVYRTLDDCLAIRAAVGPTTEVAVIGGGLLGLEAAAVLAERAARVTVVHPSPHLLDLQLDEAGGALLAEELAGRGIDVVVGRASAVLASASTSGSAEALLLDDGRKLGADVIVLTTGVRPRIEVATASGIATGRGILVDDTLATSAPDVWAVGDCAEHEGVVPGLVSTGWAQADVLAARLAGDPAARYRPVGRAVRLKVAGVEVAAMGERDPAPGDEELVITERRRRRHRRLLIRDGRLVGAVAYGDPDGAATLIGLWDRGEPLPPEPLDVLCSTDAFRAGAGGGVAPVCTCNTVDEAQIVAAIEGGADTVDGVGRATRAGTGCGTCRDRIASLLDSVPVGAAG